MRHRRIVYIILFPLSYHPQVTYASAEWSSKFTVGPKTADKFTFSLQPLWETSVDTDVNLDLLAKSDILVSVAKELDKTWQLSLFCPYWMVNKTGLTLQYSVCCRGFVRGNL